MVFQRFRAGSRQRGGTFFGVEALESRRLLTVTLFPQIGQGTNFLDALAAGPDGNVYFGSGLANNVCSISPSGVVTVYDVTSVAPHGPTGIAAGTDGNIYFNDGNNFGKLTLPGGAVSSIPVSTNLSSGLMTLGPDANFWIASGTTIQRVTPSGQLTDFAFSGTGAGQIVAFNGGLDFASGNYIRSISPSGAFGITVGTPSGGTIQAITVGSDGNLWFTDQKSVSGTVTSYYGYLTPSGTIMEFSSPVGPAAGIAAGRDGNIYFRGADYLVGVNTSGTVVSEQNLGMGNNQDGKELVEGPDGNLWWNESFNDEMGVATVDGSVPTVVVKDAGGTYSGSAFPATALVNGASSLGGVTPTYAYYSGSATTGTRLSAAPTAVGTYTVVANYAGSGSFAAATSVPRIFTINPVPALPAPTTTPIDLFPEIGQGTNFLDDLAAGPDGNVYFGSGLANNVNAISTDGAVTVYDVTSVSPHGPSGMATGTDGNVYFNDGNNFAKLVLPSGTVTNIALSSTIGSGLMTLGPDDNFWIASGTTIQRVTPSGGVTKFTFTGTGAGQIVSFNGALYFASGNYIRSISTSGAFGPARGPASGGTIQALTVGPDGNLWFTDQITVAGTLESNYGYMTPTGTITEFASPVGPASGIATGRDGNIYFRGSDWLVGVNTSGTIISEQNLGLGNNTDGKELIEGPNGNLWWNESFNDEMGVAYLDGSVPTVSVMDAGGTYTGSAFPATAVVNGLASLGGVSPTFTYYSGSTATGTPLSGAPSAVGAYTVIANYAGSGSFAPSVSTPRVFTIGAVPTIPAPTATPFVLFPEIGNGTNFLQNLAAGPDGNVYFSSGLANNVVSITPQGALTVYDTTSIAASGPSGVAAGTDGNIYVNAGNNFGDIALASSGTVSSIGLSGSFSSGVMTLGPDGNFWVSSGTTIERVTPTGAVTKFTFSGTGAGQIVSFNGGLDFISGNSIRSISTSGIFGAAHGTPSGGTIHGLAVGLDGNLWFTDQITVGSTVDSNYGYLTPMGAIQEFASTVGPAAGIALGRDGNIYFRGADWLVGVNTAGTIVSEQDLGLGNNPDGLELIDGPDGNLWWNESFNDEMGVAYIPKSTPTVTIADAGGAYTGLPFTATPLANGVASLQGIVPTVTYYTGSTATGTPLGGAPIAPGTYTAVAKYPGDVDYNSASSSSVTFMITRATPSVTVSDMGGAYPGGPFPATALVAGVVASVDSTPAASLQSVTPTIAYYMGTTATGTPLGSAPSAVGTYTAQATFAGSTDYLPTTGGIAIFNITQGVSSISVTSPASQQYTGNAYSPAASVTGSTGLTSYDFYAGSDTTGTNLGSAAPAGAGTYTIVASVIADANYLAATSTPFTFTITPAPSTITVTSPGNYVQTGNPYPATDVESGSTGAVSFTFYQGIDTTGANLGTSAPSDLGTYTVVASVAADPNYAAATSAPFTFVIALTQAASSISVTSGNQVYTGAAYLPAVSEAGSSGSVSYDYFSGTGTNGTVLGAATPITVGTYTVVASVTADANYLAASGDPITFQITTAPLIATLNSVNKVYDGMTSDPGATISLIGVVPGDMVSASGTANFATPGIANGIIVTATGITLSGASADNYALTSTNATSTANITPSTVPPAIANTAFSINAKTLKAVPVGNVQGSGPFGAVLGYGLGAVVGTNVAAFQVDNTGEISIANSALLPAIAKGATSTTAMFNVTVTDSTTGLSTTKLIAVTLSATQAMPPIFNATAQTLSQLPVLASSKGITIGTLPAAPAYTGQKIVYSLSGTSASLFTISTAGVVTTKNPLTLGNNCSFNVVATDGTSSISSSLAVTLDITQAMISNSKPTVLTADNVATALPFGGVTISDLVATHTLTVAVSLNPALGSLAVGKSGFVAGTGTQLGTYSFTGIAAAAVKAIKLLTFTPIAHLVAPGDTYAVPISVSVTDNTSATATNSPATTVMVTAVNTAPTITGTLAAKTLNANYISDHGTATPFATVTIVDPDASNVTPGTGTPQNLTVTVSFPAANGILAETGGYTGPAFNWVTTGTTTKVTTGTVRGSAAQVTAAIRALVFTPTLHQVAVGLATTTTFTITATDGVVAKPISNAATTVIAKATGLGATLTSTSLKAVKPTGGTTPVVANGTSVVTLKAADLTTTDTFAFSLVAGIGSANNADFQIGTGTKANQLLANLSGGLPVATYDVLVQVTPSSGSAYTQAMAVTIGTTNCSVTLL